MPYKFSFYGFNRSDRREIKLQKNNHQNSEDVRKLEGGNWNKAATAITTTDTFPKGASEVALIGNKKFKSQGSQRVPA